MTMSENDSPVTVELERPRSYNRLSVLLRLFVVAPHLVVFFVLGGIQVIVTLIAWASILANGKYPEGLYAASAGIFRWCVRLLAYVHLLSDDYPPLAPEEGSVSSLAEELEQTRDLVTSRTT
jgi:Domain of unknown function (DUF4389)